MIALRQPQTLAGYVWRWCKQVWWCGFACGFLVAWLIWGR